ncbi:hypothetical protein X975_20522, partial [Stegodyphus mimosarum]
MNVTMMSCINGSLVDDWHCMFVTVGRHNGYRYMMSSSIVATMISSVIAQEISMLAVAVTSMVALFAIFGISVSVIVEQFVMALVAVVIVMITMRRTGGAFIVVAFNLVVSIGLFVAKSLISFIISLIVVLMMCIMMSKLRSISFVSSFIMMSVFGISMITMFLQSCMMTVSMSSMTRF